MVERDVKKRRRLRNLENKVRWGIKDGQLDKKPKLKAIYSLIPKDDLVEFEQHINMVMSSTQRRVAPRYLQFSGGFVALLIMILGAVAITQDEAVVGIVLFILGLLFGGLGFWYRDQLIRRGWKKIAQEFKIYFKELRSKYPGVGFEFHEQGHHTRKTKNKKGKTVKEQSMSIWYSRYIVIYLPGDQSLWMDKYTEDKRSADKIVAGDSKPLQTHKEHLDEEPVVLPYWWALAKTRDGKVYYINNLKQMTQWSPPTLDQIETEKEELHEILAPPDVEESIEDSDFDDFEDEEEQELLDQNKQKPIDSTSIHDENNDVALEVGGDNVDGVGSGDDANNGIDDGYRNPNERSSRRGGSSRRNDSSGGGRRNNDSSNGGGERGNGGRRGNSRGRNNNNQRRGGDRGDNGDDNPRSSKKRRTEDDRGRKPRDSSKRRRGDGKKRGGDDRKNGGNDRRSTGRGERGSSRGRRTEDRGGSRNRNNEGSNRRSRHNRDDTGTTRTSGQDRTNSKPRNENR